VQVLSSQNLEHLGAQVMGLDPFVVLGMATAACGAVGWLVGPFLGNAIWGLVNRRFKTAVAVVSPSCLCFVFVHNNVTLILSSERERVLRQNQAIPSRPLVQFDREPCSRLLW
jgi:hypothetical protein